MSSSRGIQIRRVSITDPKDMPTHGIAETPGGTMYGTTPGGTRIIYDRLFMLRQKQAPVSRTPPALPQIPGITKDLNTTQVNKQEEREHGVIEETSEETGGAGDNNKVQKNKTDSTKNQSFQDQNEDDAVDDELDIEM